MPPLTLAVALLAAAASTALAQGPLCHYEGRTFQAGADVPTGEKCLSCQCGVQGGAPVCRLQVCPQLPVPPPKGCVLVHRREECCQRLVCENPLAYHEVPQIESRVGTTDLDADLDPDPEDRGCVVNGTRYAEGSAMGSSTLCEYCYCVRGKQQCVRPQCEMPLNGCTPKYRALTCCPVSYDCSPNNAAVSTTATPPKSSGCFVEGSHHKDGMQVRSLAKKCEHCYCLRGVVRCVKLECAPPLLGCEPVFAEGKCCPVQYNCSRIMTEPLYQERSSGNSSIFLQLSDGVRSLNSLSAIDLRKHREMTKNETADSTTMKSEPFEILKRIENEGAAILNQAQTTLETSAPSSSTPPSTQKPSTTPAIKTKPTTTKVTQKPSTQKPSPTTTAKKPTTPTTSAPTTTLKTTTVQPTSTTTKDEGVTDQIPAESRMDVDLTTEVVDTTTTLPPELEATTVQEEVDDSPLDGQFIFEILLKAASGTTTSTTPSPPTTTSTTAPPTTAKTTSAKPPKATTKVTTTTTTSTTTTTTAPPPPPTTSPPVMSDRVDVMLDELDDTTMELLELMHKEAAAAATASTTTPKTTLPPLIEALINAKNSEDVTLENEYGEALPPSLPNITMIPFLPEDAVVDKKDAAAAAQPKQQQPESSSQFGGQGVPVVGAIPPKRFSPPSSFVGGFLPRQPPLVDESVPLYQTSSPNADDVMITSDSLLSSSLSPQLISITTSTPDADSATSESAASTTTKDVPLGSHIRVASGPKACIAPDGREVKHGDLLAPPGPCEVCRCDQGTVLCHEEIECMKLIKGSENEVQKRVDSPTPMTPVAPQPPAETKIAKDDFSLDTVFKFLFEAPSSETATSRPRPAPPLVRPREPPAPNSIVGVLKLAGCNIYGRMYRVGRIISELSDQCRECKCTELGVECQPLYC